MRGGRRRERGGRGVKRGKGVRDGGEGVSVGRGEEEEAE